MSRTKKYIVCLILFSPFIFSQKIDTDSLLTVTHTSFSKEMDYKKTIKLAQLGIKNAPDYLDFHVVLGRAFQKTNQNDSARYYYKHVIDTNTKYKDVFILLSKLENQEKNYKQALLVIDKGIVIYPNDIAFYKQKLQVLYLLNNNSETLNYLKDISNQFPDETSFRSEIVALENTIHLDRIGINYSYTSFNRQNYGPWHYTSLQYSRQREKYSLIGIINFTDRRLNGLSADSGFLYEIESYFKNSPKSYSYINIGLGDDSVFPKLKGAYSYYQNIEKGWESELGIRYSKRSIQEVFSGVVGIGKYFGSNWINLRTYGLTISKKFYPSYTLSYRHYLNTKYDYLGVTTGYGTSPDERETLTQFQDRIALQSTRFSISYNKQFNYKYFIGIQTNYNHQEYFPTKFQDELTFSLSFQYKL